MKDPNARKLRDKLLAESNRRPSTPKDRRSFVYSASLPRTYSASVAKKTNRRAMEAHVPLPVTPFPECCAVMWFHTVSVGSTSSRRDEDGLLHSRRTSNDPDASVVACANHVLILCPRSTLGHEDVRDRLVIRPPLGTLYVFLRRAH